jgi:preprotein translocase subunit SecF
MFFITHRKIFYSIIGFLSFVSLFSLLFFGLRFGIEFTGGSLVEVKYEESTLPEKHLIEERLDSLSLGVYSLRVSGENGFVLRSREIQEGELSLILEKMTFDTSSPTLERNATIGPIIGEELRKKALFALALLSFFIILYVAFVFRKNDEEEEEDFSSRKKKNEKKDIKEDDSLSSWVYGFIALLVLLHDILIPLGLMSIFGFFFGVEIDVLIVMALLTILGYSVNDTIVIFDRVRNRKKVLSEEKKEEDFALTVGKALEETYTRSINTSFTTLLVISSLLIIGDGTTFYFALTLFVGVFAGTYSSLALAAPLLVSLYERNKKKKESSL